MATFSNIDYYQVLEVPRYADNNIVKAAFRRLALLKHPDKDTANPNATKEFQRINEAYEILSDQKLRLDYDRSFAQANHANVHDQSACPRSPEPRPQFYPFWQGGPGSQAPPSPQGQPQQSPHPSQFRNQPRPRNTGYTYSGPRFGSNANTRSNDTGSSSSNRFNTSRISRVGKSDHLARLRAEATQFEFEIATATRRLQQVHYEMARLEDERRESQGHARETDEEREARLKCERYLDARIGLFACRVRITQSEIGFARKRLEGIRGDIEELEGEIQREMDEEEEREKRYADEKEKAHNADDDSGSDRWSRPRWWAGRKREQPPPEWLEALRDHLRR